MILNPEIDLKYKSIYFLNQKRQFHNLKGPAIIGFNGEKQYYINGIYYSFEDWKNYLSEIIVKVSRDFQIIYSLPEYEENKIYEYYEY